MDVYAVDALVKVKPTLIKSEYGVGRIVAKHENQEYSIKFIVSGRSALVRQELLEPYETDGPPGQKRVSRGSATKAARAIYEEEEEEEEEMEEEEPSKKPRTRARDSGAGASTAASVNTSMEAPVVSSSSSASKPAKSRGQSVAQRNKQMRVEALQHQEKRRGCLDLHAQGAKTDYWADFDAPGPGSGVPAQEDHGDYLLCFLGGACLSSPKGRKGAPLECTPSSIYRTAHLATATASTDAAARTGDGSGAASMVPAEATEAVEDWACAFCTCLNSFLVLRQGMWQERRKCTVCCKNKAVAAPSPSVGIKGAAESVVGTAVAAPAVAPTAPASGAVGKSTTSVISTATSSTNARAKLTGRQGQLCQSIEAALEGIADPTQARTSSSSASASTPSDTAQAAARVEMRQACWQRGSVQCLRFVLEECGGVSSRLLDFLLRTAACLEYEEGLATGSSWTQRATGGSGDEDDEDDEDDDDDGAGHRLPSIAKLSAVTQCLKLLTAHVAALEVPVTRAIPGWRPSLVLVAGLLEAVVEAEHRADGGHDVAEDGILDASIREARVAALGLLACALLRDRAAGAGELGSAGDMPVDGPLLTAMLASEPLPRGDVLQGLVFFASLLSRRVVLLVREVNGREGGTIVAADASIGAGSKRRGTGSSVRSGVSSSSSVGVAAALAAAEQLYSLLRSALTVVDLINCSSGGPHWSPQTLPAALASSGPLLAAVLPLQGAALAPAGGSAQATLRSLLEAAPVVRGQAPSPGTTRANMLARVGLARAAAHGAVSLPPNDATDAPVVALMAYLLS